jgi:hypothetical protein
MNDGKYMKRVKYVLDRALLRMRLDKTDFDLISETFILLNEKDIPKILVDCMNENADSLKYKCVTTTDGEKIIKEAELIVNKRERDNKAQEEMKAAQVEFDKAEAARNKYLEEHNKIMNEWEDAKNKRDAILATYKDLEETPGMVEDSKEEVKNDE